jgi:hypothetical protein
LASISSAYSSKYSGKVTEYVAGIALPSGRQSVDLAEQIGRGGSKLSRDPVASVLIG